jgi:hypothetical protein
MAQLPFSCPKKSINKGLEYFIRTDNYMSLDASYGLLDASYGLLDASYGLLDTSYGLLDASYESLNTSYVALDTSYESLNASCAALNTNYAALDRSAFYIVSKSKPQVWVAGKEYSCQAGELEPGRIADKSLTIWKIVFPDTLSNSSKVAIRIEQLPGLQGGAAIPEPIVFECGKGRIQLGDLGENESLKTYSGGMWYRKNIKITSQQAKAPNISIDLGKVVASSEVFVNGEFIGRRLISPWTFDLTGKLKQGDNKIEVLVYNTLGNHFLNTPSTYIGRTTSGLIGPVKLSFFK